MPSRRVLDTASASLRRRQHGATSKMGVERIALLHPATNVAETESMMRISIAAGRIGIDAKPFLRSQDMLDYRPDLVLALTHQDAKLTPFPTYGVMTQPIFYYMMSRRFIRNILSYDAYFTIS